MVMQVLLFALMLVWAPARAADGPGEPALTQTAGKKEKKSKEEKEDEMDEAEKEAERKRKEKLARVIVLKWKDTSTDYTDETVRRVVKSKTGRPEAMFFPEVDLYQAGRKLPDRTVIPAMQPAIVPDSNIPSVISAVDEISKVPWNALRPDQWGLKAQELEQLADSLWFVDRVELREPLFLLYSQIGVCADNSNHPAPPFYEQIGNFTVNYYWYLAAQLAYQEPALMSKITDQELAGTIGYYLGQMNQGTYPALKLDFELEGEYNSDQFNTDYEILLNGIPILLDANGQFDIFLGRSDIYLKRNDSGHGLSERFEATRLEERVYPLMDAARKRMGLDFIDQLFLFRNACYPEIEGDILSYLAIYQKLHDKAEFYIAVPENGNPNKTWIWRYDRNAAMLTLVGAGADSFPVRFAILFSSGLLWNGASVGFDDDLSDESSLTPNDIVDPNRGSVELDPAMIPFNFELRGHFNRLMVNTGVEFGFNASKESEGWAEYYQTPKRQDDEKVLTGKGACQEVTETVTDTDGDEVEVGTGRYDCADFTEVLHERQFNRDIYLGVGVVLGRDAGIGFGPRFAARFGWTNMPHGWQTTAHFGWAIQPPFPDGGERVRPMIDLDLRGGIAIARARSLQLLKAEFSDEESAVMPVFGGNIGIGMTF